LQTNIKVLATFFILFLVGISSYADSWAYPKVTRYYSEDSSHMLKVVPKYIPEKYNNWVTAKPKRKRKFTAQDTTIIPCHAILYKINGSKDTVEIWNKKLINRIAPVTVLVSNDGKRIVTLDNWHSMGHGLDVFAVYSEHGELINRFQLDDFSVFPLNDYEFSVSSIWWRCGAEILNEQQNVKICMKTSDDREDTILFNLKTYKFEKTHNK